MLLYDSILNFKLDIQHFGYSNISGPSARSLRHLSKSINMPILTHILTSMRSYCTTNNHSAQTEGNRFSYFLGESSIRLQIPTNPPPTILVPTLGLQTKTLPSFCASPSSSMTDDDES